MANNNDSCMMHPDHAKKIEAAAKKADEVDGRTRTMEAHVAAIRDNSEKTYQAVQQLTASVQESRERQIRLETQQETHKRAIEVLFDKDRDMGARISAEVERISSQVTHDQAVNVVRISEIDEKKVRPLVEQVHLMAEKLKPVFENHEAMTKKESERKGMVLLAENLRTWGPMIILILLAFYKWAESVTHQTPAP